MLIKSIANKLPYKLNVFKNPYRSRHKNIKICLFIKSCGNLIPTLK